MLQGQKVEIKVGGNFDPVPMDRYTVQIADVNLVKQFNQFVGKEVDVLNYKFVILDDKPMPTKEGQEAATTRSRLLWRRCSLALNQKSWLGKLAKAVIGRDMTKEEQENFDPESPVGAQVDVMVEQTESKDGNQIFNNIVAFNKTVKKLEGFVDLPQGEQKVVEKTTVPVNAPTETEDPDAFIKGLEEDRAKAKKLEADQVRENQEPAN